MKKRVLVVTLFRDNESYIPYYLKCCEDMQRVCDDTEFHYLFYTNNNRDNTFSLLKNQEILERTKVVCKDFDKEHLRQHRTVRLAIYRDELLDLMKLYDVDNVLSIDTEIFFNGWMVKNMLDQISDPDVHIISAYSLNRMGIYFDTYAFIDERGKYGHYKLRVIEYWRSRLQKNRSRYPVKSAYGGFCLYDKDVLSHKSLSYKSGKIRCEHLAFNNKLNQLGYMVYIAPRVTPIWARNEYQFYYQMTRKPQTAFYKEMNFLSCLLRRSKDLVTSLMGS